MSIKVEINDVDRTSLIESGSLKVENNLYSSIDYCSFRYKKYGSRSFLPDGDQKVEIFDGATEIFQGKVIKITRRMISAKIEVFDIECKDNVEDMDRALAFEVYENKTVNYIIGDLNTSYLSGFTVNNVACTLEIKKAVFDGKPISKCIDELANLAGYQWYIDVDKDIHFFAKGTENAPFGLTDDNGKYLTKSLEIKEDFSKIVNSILIEGGTMQGSNYVEVPIKVLENDVDEQRRTFDTKEKFALKPQVFLNGVELSVGVDYLEDPDSYDCLWNFTEKIIRFRIDNTPGLFDLLLIRGYPLLPIFFPKTDETSIASYGERRVKIIDKTISSVDAASQKASAELEAYKDELNEGFFETYETGLKAGQKINVHSTIRSLNIDFIIKRVEFVMRTPTGFYYRVELITQRTMGLIDFLEQQILNKDKELELNENAKISNYVLKSEEFIIAESIPTKVKGAEASYTPIWVAGPYWPTAEWPTNKNRVPRADAGCKCRV